MTALFELASASVVGTEHQRLGRNNQDALWIETIGPYTLAVVADGCGSRPHSEIGAKLGVWLLGQAVRYTLENFGEDDRFPYWWEVVRLQVLGNLNKLLDLLGTTDREQTLYDYLLFSVVGVLIGEKTVTFFSCGDGLTTINGESLAISYPGNAPPYLAYGLLTDGPRFTLQRQLAAAELESFIIGTDGTFQLLAAANRPLPGKAELVGSLDSWLSEPGLFDNPDQLRRKLFLAAREIRKLDREKMQLVTHHGLLGDDTTMIIGKRKE